MKNADWNKYKNILEQHQVIDLTDTTHTDLDIATNNWTEQIVKASEETIPTTQYKILPHVKTNHEIQMLQTQYTNTIE